MMIKLIHIILFLLIADSAIAQGLSPQEIFKRVSPSVVTVYTMSGKETIAQGSGVVLNDSGYVITNYHVFAGGDKIILKQSDMMINDAPIIGVDVEKDVLILKIRLMIFPSLPIGDFDSLEVGEKVFAIGSPKGFENSLSEGIISGLRFYDEEGGHDLIQTDAAISPGSSGGALLNEKGELIGITAQTIKGGQNLNFAIPLKDVLKVPIEDYSDTTKFLISNYFYNAQSTFNAGKYETAIKNYLKILEIDSLNYRAYHLIGICYYKIREYDKSIDFLRQTIRIKPDFAEAYNNFGNAFAYKKQQDTALVYYHKALELKPDFATAFYNMGLSFKRQGKQDSAIKYYERAIAIDPNYAGSYNSLGLLYELQGKYGEAVQNYNKAIELDPKEEMYYGNMADVYMKQCNYEESKNILLKALERGFKDYLIYYNLAECYYELRIYDCSIENFLKVKEFEKEEIANDGQELWDEILAGSYYFLYLIYKDLKDKNHAMGYKEKAFALQPDWKKMKEKEILEIVK